MLTGIDHLVVAVPDLDEAARAHAALGFRVVPGGRHPEGTHNALVAFADGAYLELIAFYRTNPEHRWWTALQRGGGLVDFCLATDDLPGDAVRFRAAGVAMDDPRPRTRLRPDGYEVRWRLAIARGEDRGVAPFLIEDDTPRAERVPRETDHPNGAAGVGTVTVAVREVAPVRGFYMGVTGQPGRDIERPDVGGRGVRFTVGPHRLDLLAPVEATGVVEAWLEARGPSPLAASLRARAGGGGGALPPRLTWEANDVDGSA